MNIKKIIGIILIIGGVLVQGDIAIALSWQNVVCWLCIWIGVELYATAEVGKFKKSIKNNIDKSGIIGA
jgi:hypothetical protein